MFYAYISASVGLVHCLAHDLGRLVPLLRSVLRRRLTATSGSDPLLLPLALHLLLFACLLRAGRMLRSLSLRCCLIRMSSTTWTYATNIGYAMHHLREGQEVASPLIPVHGRARQIPDLTQPLLVDLRRHLDRDRENEGL